MAVVAARIKAAKRSGSNERSRYDAEHALHRAGRTIVLPIWLQITELNETKDELKKTAEANEAMARANVELARSADERAVLKMFQTYCSEYFQIVKTVFRRRPAPTPRLRRDRHLRRVHRRVLDHLTHGTAKPSRVFQHHHVAGIRYHE